jgi:UDP-glucose 4-epimerase
MQTVLVTGAGGVIGSKLTYLFASKGFAVRCLIRSLQHSRAIPPSSEVFVGDISDPQVVRNAISGVDIVCHLAAKLHINQPSDSLRKEYEQINVDAVDQLLNTSKSRSVQRFIFFSTINVYGASEPGKVFDENSELSPNDVYSETKARAEVLVRHSRLPYVILRPAAAYGPGMKGNYLRMLKAVSRNRFAFVGSGENRRTLVHIDDVCAATLLAATHRAALGQIFNVTDGAIHTVAQIANAMSAASGVSPPRLHLPYGLVNMLAYIAETPFGILRKRAPISRAMINKLVEDIAVNGTKIQTQLGFIPNFSLDIGWQNTVDQSNNQLA